jgi:ABC-type lipoprotein release transport system permease subunit
MIWKLAARNLRAHKVQTIVVGSIVFFGTLTSIIGGSFLDSVSIGIRKSITQTIAGDIQIFSGAKDVEFSVFGDSQSGDFPDIGQIDAFPEVKKAILENIPNVKEVVPQGINLALLAANTTLDRLLTDLREHPNPASSEEKELIEHVRAITQDLGSTYAKNANGLFKATPEEIVTTRSAVAKATSEEFWNQFTTNREASIEFLENKIAPLQANDALTYFFYVGTTPDSMMRAFPLIEMVAGEPIPPGQRGFLFNEFVYEQQIKNKVAVRIDAIAKKIKEQKARIAKSEELQQKIKENVIQSADLAQQISPQAARQLLPELKALVGSEINTLPELLQEFFKMNDDNFEARKNFFYNTIAKHIVLYRMKVGDVFPLTAVSRSGSPNSVNVKLYGIFRFKGIETSPTSGFFSILDILTFRQLYGHMTPDRKAETSDLEKEMAGEISAFDPANADSLFSSEIAVSTAVAEEKREAPESKNIDSSPSDTATTKSNLAAISSVTTGDSSPKRDTQTYTVDEMENGVTPNAAIVLHNPEKQEQTLAELRKLFAARGWNIKAKGWLEVAGALGQVAFVMKAVLFAFMAIVYFIGIFIVANAVLMSTLQRTKEIGVMRAIGGQRTFVRKLILSEIFMMSSAFGAAGVATGLALVAWLSKVGVPAPNETLQFIFSGPRLYLTTSATTVVASFMVAIAVSLLASLYPIRKAVKIQPVTAMRAD